jgi:hypothetical protein
MAFNEHFKPLWERRGYSPDMGSAGVVPPPPEGFRRLYHLTSAEYALSDIVFKRLKVARFSALNDPFELLARAATDDGARWSIELQKKALDDDLGLLCFSEDWTDPVLWTHYGSNHRGICLGFDVKEGLAKKVTYRTDRISKEEVADKTEFELLEMLIYTKFESWKFEAEWRVLRKLAYLQTEGSLHFYLLDGDIRLREVILGAQCSTSFDRMRELVPLHHRDVNVVRGRLAFGSFRIVPDERTVELRPLDQST